MSSIQEMIDKLQKINFNDILDEVLEPLIPEIIELNKEQLFSGKTVKGTDIHPLYSEDPYFNSAAQAKAYAMWKQRPEFNPMGKMGRNPDAPNLYIIGVWHSNIKGFLEDKYLEIDAVGFGSGLDAKWKDIYGLTEQHLDLIRVKIIPKIQTELRLIISR